MSEKKTDTPSRPRWLQGQWGVFYAAHEGILGRQSALLGVDKSTVVATDVHFASALRKILKQVSYFSLAFCTFTPE